MDRHHTRLVEILTSARECLVDQCGLDPKCELITDMDNALFVEESAKERPPEPGKFNNWRMVAHLIRLADELWHTHALEARLIFYEQNGSGTSDDGRWFYYLTLDSFDNNDEGPFDSEEQARQHFRKSFNKLKIEKAKRFNAPKGE